MRIKLNINIEKKYAFMILAGILLLAIAVGVYAVWSNPSSGKWHESNEVKVKISGVDYSLQEAINGGLLGGSCTLLYDSSSYTTPVFIDVPLSCKGDRYCALMRNNYDSSGNFVDSDTSYYSQNSATNKWVALTNYFGTDKFIRHSGINGNGINEPIFSDVHSAPATTVLTDETSAENPSDKDKWTFVDSDAFYSAKLYVCN